MSTESEDILNNFFELLPEQNGVTKRRVRLAKLRLPKEEQEKNMGGVAERGRQFAILFRKNWLLTVDLFSLTI